MKKGKHPDQESRNNLEAYAKLVWKIFKRTQEEDEQKRRSSLKDEWQKRFRDE